MFRKTLSFCAIVAAAVSAASGSQAADLTSKKAKPAEYVKACGAMGEGFFYIPGSNTCLKVGGAVRADYYYNEAFTRADNASSTLVRGRIEADARTATEFGLLRTFIAYHLIKTSGAATAPELENAFIQFGSITAGRARSFYDFYANDLNIINVKTSDAAGVNMLAYTASISQGVTATISLEDATDRRIAPVIGSAYGGHVMPDVVANVRVEQAWGTAQVSGALHQMRTVSPLVDTEYGFAVQAGAKFNLPMLAEGDALIMQAAYTRGAINYLGFGGTTTAGGTAYNLGDYTVTGTTLKPTTGYSFVSAFRHFWVPTWKSTFLGSYAVVDQKDAAASDVKEMMLGANLIWSPVANLDIGPEVSYRRTNPSGARSDDNWAAAMRVERIF